jgi:hypothetical protein
VSETALHRSARRPGVPCAAKRGILGGRRGAGPLRVNANEPAEGKRAMKIHVKHTLKSDVGAAFKLCTEQKAQEAVYAQLGGTDLKIKREGRAPNVKLRVSRRMPANPPAAIRKLVPATNDVTHTEDWAADGQGYAADIVVDIKGVPVKIVGTKILQPEKGGASVEWNFDVTSGIPLLGGIIASFAGDELQKNLEDEFKVLKKSI